MYALNTKNTVLRVELKISPQASFTLKAVVLFIVFQTDTQVVIMLTFKEGTNLLPAGNTALFGVLPERCLHEEQRDTAGKEEEYVWDEENT